MAFKTPPLAALLLTLLTTLTPALALKRSAGCGTTPKLITTASTTIPLNITANAKARDFFVRLPENYNRDQPHRLVLTLHALSGTAEQVIAGTGGYIPWYGLPPLAAATAANDTSANTIFVAPNGLNNGWANQGGEDVTFLRAVVAAVEADLCVDADRRFATGFSYGGAMSYALACALGGEIRAVAALSGNPQISGCAGGSGAVAYYGQHGVGDTVLPITGGREMRDRFLRNNGCAKVDAKDVAEPVSGSGKRVKTVFAGCKEDKPVVWVAFDGPHTPTPKDAGAAESWVPGETWEFFKQFK
ncbi:Alpha/Beta hydrolase protein [Lasiosphaeris hirsuta]|uniref:feruloyl esterase n=1 Tax=Lasiosphaeris hirsuta TaxID=260670 RepID=A0AA40AZS5_9PEZI|nr:Alpha/Beta hydrolase protein [Lasiosphaeris hirsuta]